MSAGPIGGRPRGEAREALLSAAKRLMGLRQQAPLLGVHGEPLIGGTWQELARHSQVGLDATQSTLKNMVRAGELQIVGAVKEDHSDRPLAVYAPAPPPPSAGWMSLQNVVQQSWQATV